MAVVVINMYGFDMPLGLRITVTDGKIISVIINPCTALTELV